MLIKNIFIFIIKRTQGETPGNDDNFMFKKSKNE